MELEQIPKISLEQFDEFNKIEDFSDRLKWWIENISKYNFFANYSLLYQLSKIVFSIDFDFDKIINNKERAYTIKRQKLSYWQNLSNKNYNKNLGAYRKTINNYSLDYLGHVLRDKLILAIKA